jgi:starch phosphorylase
MRLSMTRLTAQYSSSRSVREYTERHYLPASQRYRERAAESAALGRRIAAWQSAINAQWSDVRLGEPVVQTAAGEHRFEIRVELGRVDAQAVRVEFHADALEGGVPERHGAARASPHPYPDSRYIFRATIPATRPASDYTARVVPFMEAASVPLESNRILWQR